MPEPNRVASNARAKALSLHLDAIHQLQTVLDRGTQDKIAAHSLKSVMDKIEVAYIVYTDPEDSMILKKLPRDRKVGVNTRKNRG